MSAGSQSSDWQQCANNGRNDAIPCEWINSVLNTSKATYREGELIPFRFAIHIVDMQGKKQVDPSPLTERRVTFTYGFTKATNGNYDFIGKFDQTEGVRANLCSSDFAPVNNIYCTPGTPAGTLLPKYGQPSPPYTSPTNANHTVIPIDSSTFLQNVPAALKPALSSALKTYLSKAGNKLQIDVFGGVGLSVDPVVYNIGGGDVTATITVRFRANQRDVLMAFGAHFARLQDWQTIGYNGGAGQSGSPFHIKVDSIDGTGAGALGNNVSGGVVVREANVTLAKTVSASKITVGDAFSWTITATNNGDGAAENVTIIDTLPQISGYTFSTSSPNCAIASGILTCGPASIAALGGTMSAVVSASFVGPVNTTTSCGTFPNVARIGGTGGATAQVTITIECPSLNLVKIADNLTVSAGNPIGFVITLNSTGPGIARSATITDTLPTGGGISWSIDVPASATGCAIASGILSCSFGDLASGQSRSVHVTSPTTGSTVCQAYPNTAHAEASNNAPVQGSATTTVQCASLGITKTPASQTKSAGEAFSWTVTVTNTGQGTAFAARISDPLPVVTGVTYAVGAGSDATCAITAGTLNCGPQDLAPGGTLVAVINATTTAGTSCTSGAVSNIATGQATGVSAVKDTATVTLNCPSLAITKTPDSQTKSAGESFSWTVTLTNSGAGTAVGASINDPLPVVAGVSYAVGAGSDATCAIASGTLTCGPKNLAQNGTLVAVVNATTSANQGCVAGGFRNVATGQATGVSAVKDTATVTLNCPALKIEKTPDKAGDPGFSVKPGDQAVFKIKVTNTGLGKAIGATVTDTLPTGLTWTAATTAGTCSITSGILTCELGTLNAADVVTITLTSSTIPSDFVLIPDSPAGSPIEVKDDGNLTDGAAAGKDWATLPDSVFNCGTPKKGCDLDLPTGTSDNSFGQGTKEDTPIPTVVSGSIPNNKSDLLRFYVATERFVKTDFLYLAWERVQAPNGTTNMDFELNQSKDTSSNGVTPVRTAGDILIKYDLARGGTRPTLGVHTWVTTAYAAANGLGTPAQACEAANSFPCWGKVVDLSNSPAVEASINTGIIPEPIAGGNLDALTFGEASINLQDAGIFKANTCVSFGQAYLKSRSSDAFSSEIKDFIAPIPIEVKSCKDRDILNTAWVEADGVTPIWDAGKIVVGLSTGTASLFTAPTDVRIARASVGSTAPSVAMAAGAPEVLTRRAAARGRARRSDAAAIQRLTHLAHSSRVVVSAPGRWRGRIV